MVRMERPARRARAARRAHKAVRVHKATRAISARLGPAGIKGLRDTPATPVPRVPLERPVVCKVPKAIPDSPVFRDPRVLKASPVLRDRRVTRVFKVAAVFKAHRDIRE